ncbi:hypothetical protein [Pseudonocardia acidicola]|uniref:PIN domain-containing protein n=1 Tax=Pseudonocardia acidicola TaxID=2724939 RepID=A0ABX1SCP6_9PSEU|nr:hypothetical protein [Pseudonocardia acidicola]NMH97963.1 hypothetical protein [Pseudonocardia acidicola]
MHSLKDKCRRDIVIDTNVLVHAAGGGGAAEEKDSSLAILAWLSETTEVLWVLDDQGKRAPDLSTSVLASEYNSSLPPQSIGLALLTSFLLSNRVSFSPRPSQADAKVIRRLVPNNTRDRAVLGAAIGAQDKVLVSNDYADFSVDVREQAKENFGASIHDSTELAA